MSSTWTTSRVSTSQLQPLTTSLRAKDIAGSQQLTSRPSMAPRCLSVLGLVTSASAAARDNCPLTRFKNLNKFAIGSGARCDQGPPPIKTETREFLICTAAENLCVLLRTNLTFPVNACTKLSRSTRPSDATPRTRARRHSNG